MPGNQLGRMEYGQDLSEDAFLYTRAAVVAAGRTLFDSVLQSPDLRPLRHQPHLG
ncbi:DUF4240 domain-containing protein [Streptomyces sp. NPDC057582]|uniref:DUF4240 domain-containing protein n=1 Tax=Streptomyces sp. NPDC057582 TaxID=3346174 RepID=UPI0036C8418A